MLNIYDANAFLRRSLTSDWKLDQRAIYLRACGDVSLWVWDGDHHNDRRRAIFPGYKIRDYTGQENIFAGLAFYRELLTHTRAIQIEVPHWEADDVCGTLARKYADKGEQVVVHTNDFDFFQLTRHPLIKIAGVRPVEGVQPQHVSVYKALKGDSSDKIPGIPGFGPKSWDGLAGYYDHADTLLASRDIHGLRQLPLPARCKAWLMDDANANQICDFYEITQMLPVPEDEIFQHTTPGVLNPQAAEELFARYML